MKTIERHNSPDGKLALVIRENEDGEIVVGFEGANWHTHPECISSWLEVPEHQSVATFMRKLLSDELPIVMSIDGGQSFDPWVSDNLPATISMYPQGSCILRYWSGAAYAN